MNTFWNWRIPNFLIKNFLSCGIGRKIFVNFSEAKNKLLKMDNFVWVDLELTGLEIETSTIVEAACIVTTPDLIPKHDGIRLVIHQPEHILNSMNSWSKIQHEKSGLTSESRNSKLSLEEADKTLAEYIKKYSDPSGERYIAGNSVYMDKIFLEKYMPLSHSLLHYQILDVSSLSLLCKNWYPNEFAETSGKKKRTHRALNDILESIEQLKGYQELIFKK